MIAAARLPLRSDPANNQLERPSAHGLIWLSTWLLSTGTAPVVQVARQIEKLATGVGHAANFGDAFLETGFVTSDIVA